MSRLFRGAGLGTMVPVVQCDYQRCDKREQLSQPEPYAVTDYRMCTASEYQEVLKERFRLLGAAPQPKGWPQVIVREDSAPDDATTRDFCSWKHLRLYANRMAKYAGE